MTVPNQPLREYVLGLGSLDVQREAIRGLALQLGYTYGPNGAVDSTRVRRELGLRARHVGRSALSTHPIRYSQRRIGAEKAERYCEALGIRPHDLWPNVF